MIQAVIFDWYGTLYDKGKGAFPDSIATLDALRERGINMGLVSKTNEREKVESELKSSGIGVFFNTASRVISFEKNQNQFLYLMSLYSTTHSNTAVVGNRAAEQREIHIGNQLGCQTYCIQRGEHAHELPNEITGQPTQIITTVSDLLKYI